jgi:hypothetical protein
MGNALLLSFGIVSTLGGFALLAYALVGIARDNYKPRHTRSTYIPLRKRK